MWVSENFYNSIKPKAGLKRWLKGENLTAVGKYHSIGWIRSSSAQSCDRATHQSLHPIRCLAN